MVAEEDFRAVLKGLLVDSVFGLGGQLSVIYGDRSWHISEGLARPDRPMSVDTLYNVYCAVKPLYGYAIYELAREGVIRLDEPLASWGGAPTFADVLHHQTTVLRPTALEYRSASKASRDGMVAALRAGDESVIGDVGYRDLGPWILIDDQIRRKIGCGLPELSEAKLRDLSAEEFPDRDLILWPTPLKVDAIQQSVGFYYADLPLQPFPVAIDLLRRNVLDSKLTGGYVTARGMSWALSRLLAEHEKSPGYRRFLVPRSGREDKELGRFCSFAGGCMTRLIEHGFPDVCSDSSFGHSGLTGASFGFADPDCGLVVVCILNGLGVSEDDLRFVRGFVIRNIYQLIRGKRDFDLE